MLSRRGSASPCQDVIFEAAEDLYSNATLVFTKGAHKRIQLTRPRVASSYCYEFCGMVGVPFSALRFTLDSRPLNTESYLLGPCIIKVHHSCDILHSSQNSLQPALLDLLSTGLQADVQIKTRDSVFYAHKCILMCRSAKFKAMFSNSMSEADTCLVDLVETSSFLFDKLLKWIYTGSAIMPENWSEVCDLLVMADEYFLTDLKMRCEEDLVSKLRPDNLIELIVIAHQLPLLTNTLINECKEMFVKEFPKIRDSNPNLEEMISSVPGLMTELFSRFHRVSSKARKRRVTFRINEDIVDTLDDVSTINSGYSSTASSFA